MTLSPTIQSTLMRYQAQIQGALQQAVERASAGGRAEVADAIQRYYGQMRYHLGWVDSDLAPITPRMGKLLRPTLLLLAYEAAGAGCAEDDLAPPPADYLRRALPAAAAIELTHNFTLIHDDIEDEDVERHHRATVWKLWGVPQAINSGDGMFALARLALWGVLEEGVEGAVAARLGAALDRACLTIAEGQYLDISFERSEEVAVAAYIDMIRRKTAALMECAAEMGALLGTRDEETIVRLRDFGRAIGIAFQVRDDLLGVWASTAELGKTPAGDIYRRKKSLPILHALEHAQPDDQRTLRSIYRQEAGPGAEQVETVLAILARTGTQDYCRTFLAEQCRLAHEALANVPRRECSVAARAFEDLQMLVRFVETR